MQINNIRVFKRGSWIVVIPYRISGVQLDCHKFNTLSEAWKYIDLRMKKAK